MFKIVEPYLDPLDIFNMIGERKSELSDTDLGFIGGLIKKRKPKKIVEIGVSAGGTTCFIMRALERLRIESEMYSIDVSYTYHYDTQKKCGYQLTEGGSKILSNIRNHTLILGKNIAEVIESEVGDGIDMLILDTTHYLPGELLDFLICYPYLSQRAVIILDDLTFSHFGENTNAIATKALYDLIVADKIFPENDVVYPKMAGFILNEDTNKYIQDYFLGLMTPWWYGLKENEVQKYRDIVKKYYGKFELQLFDEAIRTNTETLKKKESIRRELEKISHICITAENVFIYGAGERGISLGMFLKDRIREVDGYIISDDRNKDALKIDAPIYHLNEIIHCKDKCEILVVVADDEVRDNLSKHNIDYIDIPNYVFPFIKEYKRLLY